MALLLACAAMPVAPADAWVPMAPDVDDPAAGDPPCEAGAWTVTTPRGSVTVTVACVGDGPATWEADLVEAALQPDGGLGAARAASPGEDWTVNRGGT